MKSFVKGTLKRIIFKSDKNYIIGNIKLKDTNDQDIVDFINKELTFTGYFHELNIDENYIFYGKMIDNQKYGLQFMVDEYKRIKPEDIDGIIDFLTSPIFPKIGEKTAKSIVETLGENTLELIKENYENLLLVPKINEKKAKNIHDILIKYDESYDTIIKLTNIGFSIKIAMLIYNQYKDNTLFIINDNPYKLIDDIDEVTFQKIDSLKDKLNIENNNKNRIFAGIIYIMKQMCFNSGDTYLKKEDMYYNINKLLNIDLSNDELEYYLIELNKKRKIIIKGEKYYLEDLYNSEIYISNFLYYLTNINNKEIKNIEKEIAELEYYFDIEYNEDQKQAIKQAITNNFCIITGGPGTGKTTIIKGIVELYKRINKYNYMDLINNLVLLAPTGRAAKRMSESCLIPASTIHRFLKWNKEADTFLINENNKSSIKFVIIDEVSMIDTNLLSSLLKGLNKNVKIVMIGDYNQLESVGPGKVLKDLIDSDMINTIFLTELYRQKENSYIAYLAREINDNDLNEYFTEKKDDYSFIECNNSNMKIYLKEVCKKALEKGYTMDDIQVLAPMYKGENGIDNLNKILQEIFNPTINQNFIIYSDIIYKENDKILQLENDPDNNVFNGDIGYIKKISNNELTIVFDSGTVIYKKKDLSKIKHGYAISIHKAQGSEFKIVIIPILMQYKIMLYRKLIYTAVTRAKDNLTLIGEINAFRYAVYNEGMYERRTTLKDNLISCINN